MSNHTYTESPAALPEHLPAAFEAPLKKGDPGFSTIAIDVDLPFKEAKQKLVDEFDRRYLVAMLETHNGNISACARAARIERMSIYKMIRRLGLEKDKESERAPVAEDEEPSISDADTGHRR